MGVTGKLGTRVGALPTESHLTTSPAQPTLAPASAWALSPRVSGLRFSCPMTLAGLHGSAPHCSFISLFPVVCASLGETCWAQNKGSWREPVAGLQERWTCSHCADGRCGGGRGLVRIGKARSEVQGWSAAQRPCGCGRWCRRWCLAAAEALDPLWPGQGPGGTVSTGVTVFVHRRQA